MDGMRDGRRKEGRQVKEKKEDEASEARQDGGKVKENNQEGNQETRKEGRE
jgi:hypothetical protein